MVALLALPFLHLVQQPVFELYFVVIDSAHRALFHHRFESVFVQHVQIVIDPLVRLYHQQLPVAVGFKIVEFAKMLTLEYQRGLSLVKDFLRVAIPQDELFF
jgi:hypothetical protein